MPEAAGRNRKLAHRLNGRSPGGRRSKTRLSFLVPEVYEFKKDDGDLAAGLPAGHDVLITGPLKN
jgi:hypothetical protein